MPAAITHHIHGESVLNYLKQEKNLQNVNETAYYWGCQGPDFLFAHRFFSWMKGTKISQFGGELHHADPNKTLRAMIQYVSTRQESVYASYLLGFFCHYSLDSTAHPYINFLAKELLADEPVQTESIMHCEIESALDTIVLRTEKGQLPSDLNLGDCFPKSELVQTAIADLYQYVVLEVLDENIDIKLLHQATEDAHRVFCLMNDHMGGKKMLLQKFETGKPRKLSSHILPLMEDDGIDYANLSETPWSDLHGKERRDTFFGLLHMAKEKTIAIIDGFQTEDIEKLTRDEPFV